MVSNDAFAAGPTERAQILAAERRTGVQLLRQTFDWSLIEPRRGHYDFAFIDAYLAATARAGLQVLPVVFGRPELGARAAPTRRHGHRHDHVPARASGRLRRLRRRPGQPLRARRQLLARPPEAAVTPDPLLADLERAQSPRVLGRAARRGRLRDHAERRRPRDPRPSTRTAEIVTAGIPDSKLGVPLATYLNQMLAAGARGNFQTLAINPYAASDLGVLAAAGRTRRLLDQAGLTTTPIWLTELGWASGGPPSSFTVGPARQARYVLNAITSLARAGAHPAHPRRRLLRLARRPAVPGGTDFWGLHTGLLTITGAGKPALSAYYQAAGVLGALPRGSG